MLYDVFICHASEDKEDFVRLLVLELQEQHVDGRERYFVKTPPQHFNDSTIPGFSADAGHQIIGGQAVPLKSFPEAAYRLEVKIVDRTSGSTITRDVASHRSRRTFPLAQQASTKA
jgi:hypothetical protein